MPLNLISPRPIGRGKPHKLALQVIAAPAAQQFGGSIVLDPLRHGLEAEPVGVAVNLSPMQFRQRGLVEHVVGALAEAGLAANRLELEMRSAAKRFEFEKAAELRDRIKVLRERELQLA